jgi:hypothetical protein
MARCVGRRYRAARKQRRGGGSLWFRVVLMSVCVALLSGCGATVVGENPEGIWFREPFIGGGDMAGKAERHCAKYGKSGVYAGTLDPTQGYALPVVAYNCW